MEKIDSLAGAGNPLAGKIFKLEQRAKVSFGFQFQFVL